jgi:cell division septation protein DedD
MVSISSHRGRYGAALVIGLVLLSAVVGPITMPTVAAQGQNQSQEQKQSQRHKLVIIPVSGSPSWSITASGSIQLDTKTTENTDSIARRTASGSVGGFAWEDNTSDPRDVVYYTGEVLQFDLGGTGNARVTLDGKRVNPTSLKNTPTPSTPTPTATTPSTPIPTDTATVAPTSTVPPTDSPSSTSSDGAPGSNTGPTLPTWFLIGLVIAGVLIFRYLD